MLYILFIVSISTAGVEKSASPTSLSITVIADRHPSLTTIRLSLHSWYIGVRQMVRPRGSAIEAVRSVLDTM